MDETIGLGGLDLGLWGAVFAAGYTQQEFLGPLTRQAV